MNDYQLALLLLKRCVDERRSVIMHEGHQWRLVPSLIGASGYSYYGGLDLWQSLTTTTYSIFQSVKMIERSRDALQVGEDAIKKICAGEPLDTALFIFEREVYKTAFPQYQRTHR